MVESNQMPVFNHPEINALYEYGWNFPKEKIEEIIVLPRETVIADLEKVIDDSFIRFNTFKNLEYDENAHHFLINAIWILSELKAEESLSKILEIFNHDDDYLHFWFGDLIHEMLPMNFWYLGVNQIGQLFDFLKKPFDWSPRAVISTALVHIAFYHEDKRAEISAGYKDLIDYLLDNEEYPHIADEEFIGGLVIDIFDLNNAEMMPYVKRLYDANLVYLGMAGNWEDYEKDFYNPEHDKEPHFERQYMRTFYAEMSEITARHREEEKQWEAQRAEREAKQKAQEAEKARKEALKPKSKFAGPKPIVNNSANSPTMDMKKLMQNKSTPRNAPCPCGSGRKYKNCHGNNV